MLQMFDGITQYSNHGEIVASRAQPNGASSLINSIIRILAMLHSHERTINHLLCILLSCSSRSTSLYAATTIILHCKMVRDPQPYHCISAPRHHLPCRHHDDTAMHKNYLALTLASHAARHPNISHTLTHTAHNTHRSFIGGEDVVTALPVSAAPSAMAIRHHSHIHNHRATRTSGHVTH
jgi:hypothetical protein